MVPKLLHGTVNTRRGWLWCNTKGLACIIWREEVRCGKLTYTHTFLCLGHGAYWFPVPLHAVRHSEWIHGCSIRDPFSRQNWHLWKSHRHGMLEIYSQSINLKTHNVMQGKSLSLICGSLRWLKDQESQGAQQPMAKKGTTHPLRVLATQYIWQHYIVKEDDDNDEPDWLRQFQVTNRVEQRQQELIKERRQALRERIRHIRQGSTRVNQSSSAQELARKRQRKASSMMKWSSWYRSLIIDIGILSTKEGSGSWRRWWWRVFTGWIWKRSRAIIDEGWQEQSLKRSPWITCKVSIRWSLTGGGLRQMDIDYVYRMEESKNQTTQEDPVEEEDFGPIKVR